MHHSHDVRSDVRILKLLNGTEELINTPNSVAQEALDEGFRILLDEIPIEFLENEESPELLLDSVLPSDRF